jgi:sulfide:quinone oxidoreductase
LEALHGLRSLSRRRVELTLIAAADEFVYRPLTAREPFAVGRTRRVPLADATRQANAELVSATVEAVDARRKVVVTSDGIERGYDALLLAVGAEATPAIPNGMTWDDRLDAEMLGGLLRDIDEGYSHSLAVVIPEGPVWPLRGYELALLVALEARSMSANHRTTLITPVTTPLERLGSHAINSISGELARAGVTVESAGRIEVEGGHPRTVLLQPSGQRVEAERILALPVLHGRPIAGVPTDADGFIDVDDHSRVRTMDGVWAAGDATTFPVKSGGCAAAQAAAAAEDIAATVGTVRDPKPFEPESHPELVGLPTGRFLEEWLVAREDEPLTTHLPIDAVPMLTYLQRDLAASSRGRS